MSDHLESCGGAPWDVTNAAKNPNGSAAERETVLDVPRLTAVLRAAANSPEFWQHGMQLRALADRLPSLLP